MTKPKGKKPAPGPATLGSTVRRLRLEKRLAQKQLATFAGLDPAVISRIESGKVRQVWPQTVERLATALGVGTDLFFGVAEPELRESQMPPVVREIHSLLMAMTDDDRVVVLGVARALDEKTRRLIQASDSGKPVVAAKSGRASKPTKLFMSDLLHNSDPKEKDRPPADDQEKKK